MMSKSEIFLENNGLYGGEGGIRTLGTVTRTTVFETVPFNHSGTSPHGEIQRLRLSPEPNICGHCHRIATQRVEGA